MANPWEVPVGQPFTVTLPDQPNMPAGLGARVETPVVRAIVSNFELATESGGYWSAVMDGVVAAGAYNVCWRAPNIDPPTFETFVPIVAVLTPSVGAITPVDYPPVDLAQITPGVTDVARLVPTRTVDSNGDEQGTFNPVTRPTDAQAADLIEQAVDIVLAELPRASHENFNPDHYGQTKRAVTMQAALLVELGYYREQAEEVTARMWQQQLGTVIAALAAKVEADLAQQNLPGGMEPRIPSVVDPTLLP